MYHSSLRQSHTLSNSFVFVLACFNAEISHEKLIIRHNLGVFQSSGKDKQPTYNKAIQGLAITTNAIAQFGRPPQSLSLLTDRHKGQRRCCVSNSWLLHHSLPKNTALLQCHPQINWLKYRAASKPLCLLIQRITTVLSVHLFVCATTPVYGKEVQRSMGNLNLCTTAWKSFL